MSFEDAAVRLQVRRVCDSATFRNAARLCAFLNFIVEETLAGRAQQIKEYSIGRTVCGRPATFDPKCDPIVRVDAMRLRSRLDAYYDTTGVEDEIQIELSKGSYVPSFRRVSQPVSRGERHRVSLAVLPFVDLSAAGPDDHLGDSIAEELIHSLARVDGLDVIARSSVFQFKKQSLPALEIGRRFQVDHVLEGSIRVVGGRLRITAQLVEIPEGWLLWSEKYETSWEEVFDVQDQITASITDALRIRLAGSGPPDLFLHATEDAEAYADYLRGRHYWNQRTPDSLVASIRSYERALGRDPNCAPALTGVADTLMVMALNDHEPTLALMPRARAAARKAFELRPGWPQALASLGCVRSIFDWDWEGGGRDLQEAVRRGPGLPIVHYLYAITNLAPRGLWEGAMAEMRAALRLDPASPLLLRDLGLIEFLRRNWNEAEAAWQKAEELDPAYRGCLYWRGRLAIETGRFDDALRALQGRVDSGRANTRVLATIAYAWARRGDPDRAGGIWRELHERARLGRVPPLDFAVVAIGLDRIDEALDWLEKACQERAAPLYQFAVDPIYDAVRMQPRAEALRLAIGLPRITSR